MKSKIMVEYDFDIKEPFLQIRLDGENEEGEALADKTLKKFIEISHDCLLHSSYRAGHGSLPMIRILDPHRAYEDELISASDKFQNFASAFLNDDPEEFEAVNEFFLRLRSKIHNSFRPIKANNA